MTDLRQQLIASCAREGAHLRLVKPMTRDEIDEELALFDAEIEPLLRGRDALLKQRDELDRQENSAA